MAAAREVTRAIAMSPAFNRAIVAVQMFGRIEPEAFGHLGAALLTMFKVMTQGWPEVADRSTRQC